MTVCLSAGAGLVACLLVLASSEFFWSGLAICRGLCLSAGGGLYTQVLLAIPPRFDWRDTVLFAGVFV